MPRPPAWLLWLATLGSGVALGLSLGHRGPIASAQSAKVIAPKGEAAPAKGADQDELYADLARTYEKFRVVDRAFEMVARVVSPAVVHITARKPGNRDDGDPGRVEESGSGVIVRPEGSKGLFVLTNHHVVDRASAEDIIILLHDGQALRPAKFWTDPKADVAVLKIDRDDLPSARLGNSDDARVGTWVLALGSPFGLTHSVSQGIISARGRYEAELEFDGVEHQEFLQTDAAINPGNSGGPLVNLKGEVVGLNTAIASEGGGSEGVGFSIPINLARWAMTQLVASGKVSRGAMGVNLEGLTPRSATEFGLPRPRGARVALVHPDSPAEKAGLLPDDVILRYNGAEVTDDNHLINLVSVSPIGGTAELSVWRARRTVTARVTIADRDAVLSKQAAQSPPRPGPRASEPAITLSELDAATRLRLFGKDEGPRGWLVTRVNPSGVLARAFRPSDVIETLGGSPVGRIDEVLRLLDRHPGSSPLEVGFRRVEGDRSLPKTIRLP